MSKIDDLRAEIDSIDSEILELLDRRARAAEQVGEAKRKVGVSFYDPERERAVLDRLAKAGAGHFPSPSIRSVFREIMSGCLSLQEPVTIAFVGPEGSFSHMAARHLFGLTARYHETNTLHAIFDAVRRGHALCGVVPIESSTEGLMTNTLDALVESDLLIRQELILEASQCLLSRANRLSAIERVFASPHTLVECQLWLAENLPGIQLVQTASTSAAAHEARTDERGGAIGSKMVGELAGLAVLGEGIQDRREAATRFVVIAKQDAPRTGTDKTTLAFSLPDAAARGALKRALEVFDETGINLSRIESRPKGNKPWEYIFLVDVEGHRQEPEVTSVIEKLAARCDLLKVLGSYPRFAPK